MNYLNLLFNIFTICALSGCSQGSSAHDLDKYIPEKKPTYQVKMIWNQAPHNAFTDLIRYNDCFYCTFREGAGHAPTSTSYVNGNIRLLRSKDGVQWQSVTLLSKDSVDLRDPKLSITPDNRLMILMGGSYYLPNGTYNKRLSHVCFMTQTEQFSALTPVSIAAAIRSNLDWLWRVTWDKRTNTGYGVVVQNKLSTGSNIVLVKTTDGIHYDLVKELDVDGSPNESTVQFTADGKMRLIVRRETGDKSGRVGYSPYPYTNWTWYDFGYRLGGPNLITLPNGRTFVGSRYHPTAANFPAYTMLYLLSGSNRGERFLQLPSGGDTSYTGLVVYENELWVSYHSTHESKTSIYLARIPLTRFDGASLE